MLAIGKQLNRILPGIKYTINLMPGFLYGKSMTFSRLIITGNIKILLDYIK
jgi:hypothetical protein